MISAMAISLSFWDQYSRRNLPGRCAPVQGSHRTGRGRMAIRSESIVDDTIMSEQVRYSMLIQWSDEDQAYLVALPEWEGHLFNWDAATHGATYEEAARHGREVLELLVEN